MEFKGSERAQTLNWSNKVTHFTLCIIVLRVFSFTVINWLNKQVNEVQMTRKPAGMFDTGVTAPGPQVAYKPANTSSVSRLVNILFYS